MLKASLHLHTASDDRDCLSYSDYQAIDRAAQLNFDVISITCHNKVVFNKELESYAASKNILLIPGIEKSIKRRHVLILNADKDAEKIDSFDKLKTAKQGKNWLTIVAHPFYPPISFWAKDTIKHMDLFDAIEHSYFYSPAIDFNKKAYKVAAQFKKPVIGTSDIHILKHFDPTYTLIDAEKNIESIFEAIKSNRIKVVSKPFKTYTLGLIVSKMILRAYPGRFARKLHMSLTSKTHRSVNTQRSLLQ